MNSTPDATSAALSSRYEWRLILNSAPAVIVGKGTALDELDKPPELVVVDGAEDIGD